MAHSRKKAIVRTTVDEVYIGYLPAAGFVGENRTVELLDPGGRIVTIALAQIRMIAFVRDFNLGEAHPEQLTRRTFLARPRAEGLWVRLMLQNGDALEGLAASDASLLDELLDDFGLFLTPPDVRCNTQRVFVPRTAITKLQVVAVVTSPSKKDAPKVAGREQTERLPFPG